MPHGSTSLIAGQRAALRSGSWRRRILSALDQRELALFELGALFEVPDHTISGRLTELARDGYIERTGERRIHPVSGCPADVWRVRRASEADRADWRLIQSMPACLMIDGEMFDLQKLLPEEKWPGIPYARRTDSGALRQAVRVELVECPGCGKPLKFVPADRGGGEVKQFRCGTPECNQVWEAKIIGEPGQPKLLAMVSRTF